MEPCPNCGQLSRVGAKFCTICGARMAGNGNPPVEQGAVSINPGNRFGESSHTEVIGGWPSPVEAPDTTSTEVSGDVVWGPPPAPAWETPRVSTASDAAGEEGSAEEFASVWSGGDGTSWPAALSDDDAETVGAEAEPEIPTSPAPEGFAAELAPAAEESGTEATAEPEAAPTVAFVEVPRVRIARLMDELRDSIASLGRDDALDLTGVIAELEVAVTPPGAMRPEELAELRNALQAAREHPREIDTMLDLSGRINAMMALTIAYDRAIAAIERSLEVLRRT